MAGSRSLIFLAYVSRMLCKQEDVEDILRVSRANNGRDGLTGFLLHDQRQFFQIIEGDPARVGAALLRIADDPRHRDVRLLAARKVDFRLFSNWSLKSATFSDGRATLASRLAELEALSPGARAEAIQALALAHTG